MDRVKDVAGAFAARPVAVRRPKNRLGRAYITRYHARYILWIGNYVGAIW